MDMNNNALGLEYSSLPCINRGTWLNSKRTGLVLNRRALHLGRQMRESQIINPIISRRLNFFMNDLINPGTSSSLNRQFKESGCSYSNFYVACLTCFLLLLSSLCGKFLIDRPKSRGDSEPRLITGRLHVHPLFLVCHANWSKSSLIYIISLGHVVL